MVRNLDSTKDDERTWRDDSLSTYSMKSIYEKIKKHAQGKKKTCLQNLGI